MQTLLSLSPQDEEVFVAGQKVPAGIYQEVDRRREVRLEKEDVLPASFDGRVATYVRRPQRWAEIMGAANGTRH